jgi:hypothetical protein
MEEMLIEKVRQRTFLYDTKSPDYRDQHMTAKNLRQRRYEEKTTIRDMDETDMFSLSMAKMTKKLPSLEQAKIKL